MKLLNFPDRMTDVEQDNIGKDPAWQRKEGKNPSGGLNLKVV